jgi:hypothetical protein
MRFTAANVVSASEPVSHLSLFVGKGVLDQAWSRMAAGWRARPREGLMSVKGLPPVPRRGVDNAKGVSANAGH